jgi:hypothetical protein
VPSYRHRVPAGTGLVVVPGRRRQPSTCWIDKVTCRAPFSRGRIIGMVITSGTMTIVSHRHEPRPAAEAERKL